MSYYVIPHLKQDGKNCWWWAVKMIKHYHRKLAAEWQEMIDLKRALLTMKSPNGGLSVTELDRLRQYNFAPVPYSLFGPSKKSGRDLEVALDRLGPLFCGVFTSQFGWSSEHALVINGSGYDEGKNEDIFWFHDPAADSGPNQWPLDYLLMLTKFINVADGSTLTPRVTPLWYYTGTRLQIHKGEA
jgi:papain like cysteine protease AvrRpt2